MKKLEGRFALGAILSALVPVMAGSYAYGWSNKPKIEHVLLISVDGLHALDFANCANGLSTVNSGTPYCPNLASLGLTGTTYVAASTSKPSDSFPGLMTLMTGASPRTMGVYYDVAFDRTYNPPKMTSGNGNPGGPCTPGVSTGYTTEYDEGIDIDKTKLNGGAPSGDGGVKSIDPDFLVRNKQCAPVYPWNFIRGNTIFGVIHNAGGYTAWSDKHASYSAVGGPTGGSNVNAHVDDYYSPEINSNSQDYGSSDIKIAGCNPLPDQLAVAAGDDYTGSFQNIQCYDGLKVQAILNEIDGMNHNATATTKVPTIFGMNFQAVSIGEKLIYQHGVVAPGYSESGGYLDNIGTPSASLLKEIEFVDTSIGSMVTELKSQGLYDSTLIIITAKHGQSPIDSSRYLKNGSPNDPATILASYLAPSENSAIGPTEDDVALLWLADSANTSAAVAALESASPPSPAGTTNGNIAGIGEIFSGPGVSLNYNTPGLPPTDDPRTPDIIVTPNIGVTYSNSKKKLAEHGGFSHDDTNVILLVSQPTIPKTTVYSTVTTAQVAPTILKALGLNPSELYGVVQEGTVALPKLPF
jgi:hypothetical protein